MADRSDQNPHPGTLGSNGPNDPAQDATASRDIESLARWMDTVFEIPVLGLHFGLDAILGLLPGAGDFATSAASIYILTSAQRYGVTRAMLARMALNIMIDL